VLVFLRASLVVQETNPQLVIPFEMGDALEHGGALLETSLENQKHLRPHPGKMPFATTSARA
jgi:hypothetical protein